MCSVAQLSRNGQYQEQYGKTSKSLEERIRPLLHAAQSFDPSAWASDLQSRSPASDLALRTHVASAHRAAVCIYLARLMLSLRYDTHLAWSLKSWASETIEHMAWIRPCDALFTATTWPAFIAGAETHNLQEQSWTVQRFSELWQVEPWGTIGGALDVLRGIWSDRKQHGSFGGDDSGCDEAGNGDWIAKLRDTGVDWLII